MTRSLIMMISQQSITIEGRQAKYWIGGSGKPLVLIHGGLGDAQQHWAPVFEALSQRFLILAPDLPGFGVSAPLPMPSYQNYLNWLQLLFDMLNIGGPLLMMGNSFGAASVPFLRRRKHRLRLAAGLDRRRRDHRCAGLPAAFDPPAGASATRSST